MDYRHLVVIILLCGLAVVPIFAQVPADIDELEWRVIDDFEQGAAGWNVGEGSPFLDRELLSVQQVDARPIALALERPGEDQGVLGIRAGFERRGHNMLGFVPADGAIRLDGAVQDIEIWVWGMLREYDLEVVLQEGSGPRAGIQYTIPLGNIAHRGWQKLTVRVSDFIPSQRSQFGIGSNLELVNLTLRTQPNESVDEFFLYLDDLRYRSATLPGDAFDGQDLLDPDRIDEVWGGR